jgi:hypothetical protein
VLEIREEGIPGVWWGGTLGRLSEARLTFLTPRNVVPFLRLLYGGEVEKGDCPSCDTLGGLLVPDGVSVGACRHCRNGSALAARAR